MNEAEDLADRSACSIAVDCSSWSPSRRRKDRYAGVETLERRSFAATGRTDEDEHTER